MLKAQLPAMVATHYTPESGKWVANGYSSPLGLVMGLSITVLVVYFAMTFATVIKVMQVPVQPAMEKWVYYFKLAIIVFIQLIAVYSMLAASHSLRELSDASIANATMIRYCSSSILLYICCL